MCIIYAIILIHYCLPPTTPGFSQNLPPIFKSSLLFFTNLLSSISAAHKLMYVGLFIGA